MKSLKDAWIMITRDLKNEKIYLLIGFVFTLYIGGAVGSILWEHDQYGVEGSVSFASDFLLLLLFPMVGFYYSRRSFKYLTEDSYSQMLAYYRSLPITIEVVFLYRVLQAILMFAMNGLIFFSLLYVVVPYIRDQLSFSGYLAFSITWIGYGILITGIYIALEFLNKGKIYFFRTVILMILTMGVVVLIAVLGGNVLLWTIEYAKEWRLLSPVMWASIGLGIINLIISRNYVIRKLRTRDLF